VSVPLLVRVVARDRSGPGMAHSLARLGFGRPVSEDIVHGPYGAETIYHFVPGELFCLVWWRRRPDGNQHWTLVILETPCTPNVGHVLPNIHPAVIVHAMVDQHGPAGQEGNVDQMLYLIQSTQDRGIEPWRLPTTYWQEAAWRIVLGETPPDLPDADDADGEEASCDG